MFLLMPVDIGPAGRSCTGHGAWGECPVGERAAPRVCAAGRAPAVARPAAEETHPGDPPSRKGRTMYSPARCGQAGRGSPGSPAPRFARTDYAPAGLPWVIIARVSPSGLRRLWRPDRGPPLLPPLYGAAKGESAIRHPPCGRRSR